MTGSTKLPSFCRLRFTRALRLWSKMRAGACVRTSARIARMIGCVCGLNGGRKIRGEERGKFRHETAVGSSVPTRIAECSTCEGVFPCDNGALPLGAIIVFACPSALEVVHLADLLQSSQKVIV